VAVTEFVDADGTRWRRTGECNGCGECCRSGDPFLGQRGLAEVPGACPLLRLDGGLYRCKGHGKDKYYLAGCNVWPSVPDHIVDYPSCSYEFEQMN
jgi:hypothetical protein